jgi:predicted NBD/HSP70 family sugar kinase
MITIGIDVGGTHTRVAAVERTGRAVAMRRFPTAPDAIFEALVDRLIRSIADIREEVGTVDPPVQAAGLALPGLIDRERGVLRRSINLPLLEGRPIVEALARGTGWSVTSMSDADAATWAECAAIEGAPARAAHLRLGTGVACGVVIDGRLLELDADRAAHLDVLVVADRSDARGCRCGRRGCLETVASGAALDELARQAGYADGLQGLRAGWRRKEPAAQAIVRDAARGVSAALVNLRRRFETRVISVGGGVLSALPFLFELAVAEWRAADAADGGGPGMRVERSRLGDEAGVIGAGLLAQQEKRSRR